MEGLLRLRRLVTDNVDVTLVAPNDELVYRPLAVREPFGFGAARRYPLERIAADAAAHWLKDTLGWVEPNRGVLNTGKHIAVPYDALLIAVGSRQTPAFRHVTTFRDAEAEETFGAIVRDVEAGDVQSLAFVLPGGPVHLLPLYELALMTAARAAAAGKSPELSLITPEPSPLAAFGAAASDAVTARLAAAGIRVYLRSTARILAPGQLTVRPRDLELQPDRIVAMPHLSGPSVRGIAGSGAAGFLPIDDHCRVVGTNGRIYGAGDAAGFPIKHGGLGSQQADAAAAGIAQLAGVEVEVKPYHPTIRGMLLTGAKPLYLSARMVSDRGFESEVFDDPPWPADDKIVAEELGPYLANLKAEAEDRT